GERALSGLAALAEVKVHEGLRPLDSMQLIEAAQGCQIIVADRATACAGAVFAALPELVAVCRVAVDIRNIDVAAASQHGVLVTHAGRSWVAAVSELVIGLMLDAARGISRANLAYKRAETPSVHMGRQLAGSSARWRSWRWHSACRCWSTIPTSRSSTIASSRSSSISCCDAPISCCRSPSPLPRPRT